VRGGERYDRRELCEFDPFPRTVGEVLQEVLRKEAPGKRPKPQHKRARAELTREEGGEKMSKGKRWCLPGCDRRRTHRVRKEHRNAEGRKKAFFYPMGSHLFGLCESAEELAREELGEFVSVLDLMHVTPRLWDAAHCFHAEGSDAAREYVDKQLERVLSGKTEYVIRGLRGNKANTIAQVTQYYEKNQRRMHYSDSESATNTWPRVIPSARGRWRGRVVTS